jgi:Zn-dependent peptidase ImmA (M78 family)
VKLTGIDYRKHSRLTGKAKDQIEVDIVEQVERYLEVEAIFPNGPLARYKEPLGLPKQVNRLDDVEQVADAVREAWGLRTGPIAELTDTLEQRGIIVLQSNVQDQRFVGCCTLANGLPVIVVGRDWPGDRQRFTLAHELGHIVLKGRLAPGLDEEKACHRFAGAFLVLQGEVMKELGQRRTRLEPRELFNLKFVYGVSMGAWLHRARDTGIVAENRYLVMVKLFRAKGWHKKEPGHQYPREQPKLFEQLVFRALAENLISESKAAELLQLSLRAFQERRNVNERAASVRHQ